MLATAFGVRYETRDKTVNHTQLKNAKLRLGVYDEYRNTRDIYELAISFPKVYSLDVSEDETVGHLRKWADKTCEIAWDKEPLFFVGNIPPRLVAKKIIDPEAPVSLYHTPHVSVSFLKEDDIDVLLDPAMSKPQIHSAKVLMAQRRLLESIKRCCWIHADNMGHMRANEYICDVMPMFSITGYRRVGEFDFKYISASTKL